jgi:hypothetical protein
MSIVEKDLKNNPNPLGFVLCDTNRSKIMGVYTQISLALRGLYLADENAMLNISVIDQFSKACINDTYDNFLGILLFEKDVLVYRRNLTKESEAINDPKLLIDQTDFDLIKNELDRTDRAQNSRVTNIYHDCAHEAVDEVIIRKFNELSSIYEYRLIPLIMKINEQFDMAFDFESLHESNRFYQESNEKLVEMNLEDKVAMLDRIDELLAQANNEIQILKELNDSDCPSDDEDSEEIMALKFLPNNSGHSLDDIDDENEWYFSNTRNLSGRQYHGEDGSNLLDFIKANNANNNNKQGKVLYTSPPSSPTIDKIKLRLKPSSDKVKKNVNFNLDEIEIHHYSNETDDSSQTTE